MIDYGPSVPEDAEERDELGCSPTRRDIATQVMVALIRNTGIDCNYDDDVVAASAVSAADALIAALTAAEKAGRK